MFNRNELGLLMSACEVYAKQIDVLAILGVKAYDLEASLAQLKARINSELRRVIEAEEKARKDAEAKESEAK